MTTQRHYNFGENITAIMSSANQFGKNKRSIKRQMAIARKSRSVRRNIRDNDMIVMQQLLLIQTQFHLHQVMNHLSALMMLLYLVQK